MATKELFAFGEYKTVAEWARDSMCAVSKDVLEQRLADGVPAELAIKAYPMDDVGPPYPAMPYRSWRRTRKRLK